MNEQRIIVFRGGEFTAEDRGQLGPEDADGNTKISADIAMIGRLLRGIGFAGTAERHATTRLERVRLKRKISAMYEDLDAARWRMAEAFGAQRGYRLGSRFAPSVLARRGVSSRDYGELWESMFADHRYFYRTPNRHAAAVVAHLYDLDEETRQGAVDWAAGRCLKASFPAFPSWWYPGRTTLVVFEPIESRA